MRLPTFAILLLIVFGAWGAPGLEERISALLPTSQEERWLQIPWRMDLLKARYEANQSGRPVFMWLMDGDPLGCT